jgi:FtsZ-interacting cell division protein ZipA
MLFTCFVAQEITFEEIYEMIEHRKLQQHHQQQQQQQQSQTSQPIKQQQQQQQQQSSQEAEEEDASTTMIEIMVLEQIPSDQAEIDLNSVLFESLFCQNVKMYIFATNPTCSVCRFKCTS